VDRLHYYYTTTFLLVVAVLISLKMFGGSPIECWLPAEFRPSWQEYTGFSFAEVTRRKHWVDYCWRLVSAIKTILGEILIRKNLEQFPRDFVGIKGKSTQAILTLHHIKCLI
jgi:hypothetical protein